VGESVQLSIRDKFHTDKITGWDIYLDGVARGKASANPILCHNVAIKTITIHVIEVVISITTIMTYLHNCI
jgi:hypothetical protein